MLTLYPHGPTEDRLLRNGRTLNGSRLWRTPLQLALLTALAFAVLGYHPYAEDGGIYTAALLHAADPSLYPGNTMWVASLTEHTFFVPVLAAIVHCLHVRPEWLLLALQISALYVLLAGAAHLACTLFPSIERIWAAALAVAVGAGLPVAGTALYGVDPYSTARSLSTPLLLFALSHALRSRWTATALFWCAAALLHPLMALWAALLLITLRALESRNKRQTVLLLTLFVFTIAGLLNWLTPPENSAARQAALTRAYWFPSQWRWHEWIGGLAPLLLLVLLDSPKCNPALKRLTQASTVACGIAVLLAVCFARSNSPNFAVARLQPLRTFHLVFLSFLAILGATLTQRLQTPRHRRTAVTCVVVAASVVYLVQRGLYSHTTHIEWPGATPTNTWEQAFLWCRSHTSADALFALDADYVNMPGEDGHGFRAVARRSALPDGVKDAGIVSVKPKLAAAWQAGVASTRWLNRAGDAERLAKLSSVGVHWIVLPAGAATAFPCPYRNTAAKICRIP